MNEQVRVPRTESGRRLMTRELWEWLPEAYQMSHARLNDVIVAIEDDRGAARYILDLCD